MNNYKKRDEFYQLFFDKENSKFTIFDFLKNSSCDEVVKIDMSKDTFTHFYHVEGKYYAPLKVITSYSQLVDVTYNTIVHPEDKEIYLESVNPKTLLERLHNSKTKNFLYARYRYLLQNGSYRYVEQCFITGEEYGIKENIVYLFVFDIQNMVDREPYIDVEGEYVVNPSTAYSSVGLANEPLFLIEGKRLFAEDSESEWCVISIDIRNFRLFEQWYTHEAGKTLIDNISRILLEKQNHSKCIACHLGQDDFAIMMKHDKDEINKIYQEIKLELNKFGASIGFVPILGIYIVEDGVDISEALDRAKLAASKAKGANIYRHIVYYDKETHLYSQNEYHVLAEFMEALKNDEFVFYFQPQCRISTRKIVGVESLARWVRKDGTLVPPNDFIPLLEKYGFIIHLDQYLWDKVFRWIREWIDEGHIPVPVSLNVSRADIFSIDILDCFLKLSKKYNVPPKYIKLEITESIFAENIDDISSLVKKLRKAGFLVMMDDFGSGYSSLNMLNSIEVDVIKLDGEFLRMKEEGYEKSIHILESVVNMAKILSLPIVVEGVETKEQIDFLEGLGCRYVQGFYFYRPMPAEQLKRIIEDTDNIDPRGFVMKTNEQFRIREFLDKNIYSDSMLNNILGPVAYYSWHGDDVDIIRFNEQFYKTVNVPDFHDKLYAIQNVVPKEDVPCLYDLLKRAMKDRLNGSEGIIHFYTVYGTLTTYVMHFYYLGSKVDGERFYGSVRNISELEDLRQQIGVINRYSSNTYILVRHINGKRDYKVVIHGLKKEMGMSTQEMEDLLNGRIFHTHFVNGDQALKDIFELAAKKKPFAYPVDMIVGDRIEKLIFNADCVSSMANNIDYIIKITKRED